MGGQAAVHGSFPGGDRQGRVPAFVPEDDFDLDEHFAWLVREIDAGRVQAPPESALEGPAISVSLGDACDVDPKLLAAMCGPEGLGGQAVSAAFGQDKAADVLRPGPVLAALTAPAVSGTGSLTDSELIGVLQASRRLENQAAYQQTVVIAEFARRRQAEFVAAKDAGKPVGCRDGEFPGEELAMELVGTGAYAGARIDAAIELTTRLPRTLAGMADGTIDLTRACTIASRTRSMTDEDAAYADAALAAVAPELRPDQLARKAATLELKLAPDAVRARKELARQLNQRVEARREESGNASLAGRELDTADVIASKAHIDAIAVKLRDSGLIEGNLDRLRALALTDLTQGRNPLDRIKPQQATNPSGPGDPAPLPALINLLVPAGTVLGWGTAPAQAAGWGLLDAHETGAVIRAASQHPRTRWCFTLVAPDGTAIAHACAKGQHPWKPPDPPNQQTMRKPGDIPTPGQSTQLADFLRRFGITFEPIARDTCDHRHAEKGYVPSRKLKHLLRARTQTCTAPACNAQAQCCDIDHTVPYPNGPTCECNTDPKCRRHHRTKQAPGWKAAQPTPDTSTWTTPSGRTHSTGATTYDL
ncbi:MAG: hypothetical protein JWO75_1520 [Actinomycetia bacterium]|nr:hypothetical protein [Actinomycetes bacterium]